MNEAEYRNLLAEELAAHTTSASAQIRKVLQHLPPKAVALTFEIIPEQDGEGEFSVCATLAGPDTYVLNKAIRPYATVLSVIHTEDGLEPPVPLVDPSSVDFEVNNVLVDIVATWLKRVWKPSDAPLPKIPVWIVGHDDYGTITPIELHVPVTT